MGWDAKRFWVLVDDMRHDTGPQKRIKTARNHAHPPSSGWNCSQNSRSAKTVEAQHLWHSDWTHRQSLSVEEHWEARPPPSFGWSYGQSSVFEDSAETWRHSKTRWTQSWSQGIEGVTNTPRAWSIYSKCSRVPQYFCFCQRNLVSFHQTCSTIIQHFLKLSLTTRLHMKGHWNLGELSSGPSNNSCTIVDIHPSVIQAYMGNDLQQVHS